MNLIKEKEKRGRKIRKAHLDTIYDSKIKLFDEFYKHRAYIELYCSNCGWEGLFARAKVAFWLVQDECWAHIYEIEIVPGDIDKTKIYCPICEHIIPFKNIRNF